ncbi:MAG: glycosyltransferase family 9 protein [Chloroflexi bacterium]|nr:glycosyltransferase family 9 protein [Chloroflexota bacterium]
MVVASRRHVVIIKPCCLGDLILVTALLSDIKRHWPQAEITVVTSAWSSQAVTPHPAVTRVVNSGHIGLRRHLPIDDLVRLTMALRSLKASVVLVPDRSPVLSILTRLSGIPVRVGLDSGGRGRWYTTRVPPLPRAHELEQGRSLLRVLGIPTGALPSFQPGPEAHEAANDILAHLLPRPKFVILAPGGGTNPGTVMTSKRWSAEGFAAVADHLAAQGYVPVLVGSESDRTAAAQVQALVPQARNWTGLTPLGVLGALATRASAFVGNDSGVSHLAAATGCPTVAVFGPTAAELYAPVGKAVATVEPPRTAVYAGEGTVRLPFQFTEPWQELVTSAAVIEALRRFLMP